ncbi:MAG TPA: response regulator transcription factor [Polyangiaceae bacterium]
MQTTKIVIVGQTTLLCDLLAATLAGSDITTEVYCNTPAPSAVASGISVSTIVVYEIGSIETLRALQQPKARASVALVRDPRSDLLRAILAAGFTGVVTCHASLSELKDCIQRTIAGATYLDAGVQRCLSRVYLHGQEDRLTEREQQVAILVAKGRTSRSIARDLSLSLKTVSNHRRNIFRKLRIHDAVALTHHAVNAGWITVEETPEVYPDAPEESGARSLPLTLHPAYPVTALGSAR